MGGPVVVSRYFYENVRLVANMCPICYEDCTEVRIVSINLHFLKQFQRQLFQIIFEENTLGFLEQEKENSLDKFKKIKEILKNQQDHLVQLEKGLKSIIKNIKDVDFKILVRKNGSKNGIGFKIYQTLYLNRFKQINKEQKKKYKLYYRNLKEEYSEYFNESDLHNTENEEKHGNLKEEQREDFTNHEPDLENKVKIENSPTCDNILIPKMLLNSEDIENKNKIKLEQKEFISNFLFTNFEYEYFKNRKLKDSANNLQSSWNPPRSPHNLIEECLYNDPWALLVATIFLNKTSCIVARPYVFWFLSDNPDPLTVLDKFPGDLEKYFVNLGLSRTRAIQVYRMSYDFLFKPWKNVKQLYGIGEYGECAYRMFCLGDLSVQPKDRFLKIYKAWHQKLHNKEVEL